MTADPLLTNAEHERLYILFSEAWDCGQVGDWSCDGDGSYSDALALCEAAWERRRPEVDALRRLEETVRHLRVAQADPWCPDDQQVEWERDRVREALAGLDRIREETP